MRLVERYAFIPVSAWETVQHVFPNAVSYGNSKVVQYSSSSTGEQTEDAKNMRSLVDASGLELIEHENTDSQMIIDAIESGITKVYNCDHDAALEVAKYFNSIEEGI